MNGIRPEARFVPEIHLTTSGFGLLGKRGEGFPPPLLNRRRIALIRPLQRLLRGQAKPGEQCANRRPAETNAELALNQAGHHRAGPQPRVQAIRAWIMAIDPAEHLLLLAWCQAARAAARVPGTQRFHAKPRLGGRLDPLVDRRAGEAVRGNDRGGGFAFPYPLNRHQSNGFQRLVIKPATVSFHPEPIPGQPAISNMVVAQVTGR
jgi:hypothetical protein